MILMNPAQLVISLLSTNYHKETFTIIDYRIQHKKGGNYYALPLYD